ncbi:hypothetical protein HPP92_015030 [Vanilla planifolia]|uniref:Uncharacterized protein n=1 Tax=Vanilla planifolia TaxID=51239 RepID=A0A835QKE9_VANPL|nr:hypothetical protein HPP92_015030 [Vanilla planifolia]
MGVRPFKPRPRKQKVSAPCGVRNWVRISVHEQLWNDIGGMGFYELYISCRSNVQWSRHQIRPLSPKPDCEKSETRDIVVAREEEEGRIVSPILESSPH